MPVPIATAMAQKVPGDWAPAAYRTVAAEMTASLDLGPSAVEVLDALVYLHFSVYAQAEKLKKRQGRALKLGPRSFLDFLSQYVALSNEKRESLEEEQRHLNVGLDKLKETVDAVSDLQQSLAVKRTQLEAKNAEANDKLQRMVADQKSAEEQKAASIQIQANLEVQEREIGERREVVMADLADAEPAVQEAQASVSNIKKQHLTEVRSMGNPPLPVKNAMESVCIALGHRVDSWKTVQGIIRRDDFISSIVNFDTDRQMTRAVREKMNRDYLSKPEYNYETINRASKACGPLAKWVIAQVHFSEILDRVGPLRDEVDSLERQAQETKDQAATIVDMIAELEASIARYKDEYAGLISETQAIKSEMERVQRRVDRSIHLLESLGSEKERWDAGSRTFDAQMSTVVGDALLSAGFLTYSGFFDQQYREAMWHNWSSHLQQAKIKFKPELTFADYLSSADDRLGWQSRSLPADTLCTENAIMLKRFKRFPLIIDPSGQATTWLTNEYRDRKLMVTSFLDDAFIKNLESALRFGNPLLIQDVEHLDPIINPVLNGELRKTGGRVLIRLGSQEIDFSPSFTMFLSTRDPSVEFTPDVCSRVTFVNFTMTRSSLQSQSLDQVLKIERPDTDKKRTDLMKLQGEFRLRLRFLEKSLLNALNESQGNILDDDKVIDTLETLKKEAAEVTAKVEETDAIMAEVEEVTKEYLPLAKSCSSLFFALDQLNIINHFYQFSLRFFLDIFDFVLRRNPNLKGVTDTRQRLDILTRDLFLLVFKRTTRALLHSDHLMLALLLAQIWTRETGEEDALDSVEFDFLLEGGDAVQTGAASTAAPDSVLSAEQRRRLAAFQRLGLFKQCEAHMGVHQDRWRAFLASNNPEKEVPVFWEEGGSSKLSALVRVALTVKCLRPDRLTQALIALVDNVFEANILDESAYDLQSIVSEEVNAETPIALCSVSGFDAAYRVDSLVRGTGAKCTSVAMGSQEGFNLADQAITAGAKAGHWVLLKNVHLAPSWLSQLEKKMLSLHANRNFRLFVTCETNPIIPVNFLRASRILMNEPPPGLKANMMDCLRSINPSRLQAGPVEVTRIYFLLAFFHATLIERLRYTPLGWSKLFEFNDSDAEAALTTIEVWVERVAKGRSNIDPRAVPWDALKNLLKMSVYGGKIDNDADQLLLDSFVDGIFTPQAYEAAFKLVDVQSGTGDGNAADGESLIAPEGTRMETFLDWVNHLPEQQPPQWLGLPSTAERVIAIAQGTALLSKLVRMRQLADDEDGTTVGGDADTNAQRGGGNTGTNGNGPASSSFVQPAWMKVLEGNTIEWLRILPTQLTKFKASAESMTNPLFRFWAREYRIGTELLKCVRDDLEEVGEVCRGQRRQTNHNRALLSDLTKGVIPSGWRKYVVTKSMTLSQWIADFAQRIEQLDRITRESATTRFELFSVHLGQLFVPGAYLTATRQAIANRNKISLENLQLRLNVEDGGATLGAFPLEGLRLEGATWNGSQIELNDGSTTNLDKSSLAWSSSEAEEQLKQKVGRDTVPLTVYLNGDRSASLFHVHLRAKAGLSSNVIAKRAVALRAA